MTHLLQITGKDIGALSDVDLRELTRKLCEADYRQAGLSIRMITGGGHQDAADGGADVRVRRLPDSEVAIDQPPPNSDVPRADTAFQCKKSEQNAILPNKILNEMRKPGVRALLGELAAAGGAYVIISNGSVTYKEFLRRRGAMHEAVASIKGAEHLELEFYDQTRVASWVERHPAVALWVLEKVGRPFCGWHRYDYWANGNGSVKDEYLIDKQAKLLLPGASRNPVTIEEGLKQLRSQLSRPGRAVRLVGASGVGKTRLAQALFDSRIGDDALDHHQAYYTDSSDSPQPGPIHLTEQLNSAEHTAFLIIDNCSGDDHRRINQCCCQNDSKLRLLSIDHDIRDDQPVETDVYRLLPSGDQLIKELIYKRYPSVSENDRSRIAKFSEGNTRVALALAETVRTGGTLAALADHQLFRRLFYQRHGEDKDLLNTAKAASLVYSFSMDECMADDSEHVTLAKLYEQTAATMARNLKELERRDLLQHRGIWRAILPLAISNRLAKEALEELQWEQIAKEVNPSKHERLFESFCHRIGFLHDQSEARDYARKLLSIQGLVGQILYYIEAWEPGYSGVHRWAISSFIYIAPANPEAALTCIESLASGAFGEHFTSTGNRHGLKIVKLLCKLAHSADLFQRAFAVLRKFGINQEADNRQDSIRREISILFQACFSGTYASAELRLKAVQELLEKQDPITSNLGLFLLETMLKSSGFSKFDSYDFGSWQRDYGYCISSDKDCKEWYALVLNYCTELTIPDSTHSTAARALVARQWRELWMNTKLYDLIETHTLNIHQRQPWTDAWIQIKKTVNDYGHALPAEIKARLEHLATDLSPSSLEENIRVYVCKDIRYFPFLDKTIDETGIDTETKVSHLMVKAYRLGARAGQDKKLILQLLPILISTNSPSIQPFYEGLANSLDDIPWLVEACFLAWREADPNSRRLDLLKASLTHYAIYDEEAYEACLDKLMLQSDFDRIFPYIQLSLNVNDKAVHRLVSCLKSNNTSIHAFKSLSIAWDQGRIQGSSLLKLLDALNANFSYSAENIRELATMIAAIITGPEISTISDAFKCVAKDVLVKQDLSYLSSESYSDDVILELIAKKVFYGESGSEPARIVATKLLQASSEHSIDLCTHYRGLMTALAFNQPLIFLDTFLGSAIAQGSTLSVFSDWGLFHGGIEDCPSLLDQIGDTVLFQWCDQQPQLRYPALAGAITLCRQINSAAGKQEWAWTPLALELLTRAPHIKEILVQFKNVYSPRSWSGSRADMIEKRLPLLDILKWHSNASVAAWATEQILVLQDQIVKYRKSEKTSWNELFQRFE